MSKPLAIFLPLTALLGILPVTSGERTGVGTCRVLQPHVAGCVFGQGTPLAGARVGIQGSAKRVETDCSGGFCLPERAAAGARIVAWKSGYYIGSAEFQPGRPLRIQLKRHPQEHAEGYQWVDPNPDPAAEHNCANCHVEIYRQWSASSHARSAVNRHFLDVFAGTDWYGRENVGWNFSHDQPDARAVCVACHVPTVPADDPVARQPARVAGVAREGIHCDFCHKIAGTELAEQRAFLGLSHGRDALRLVRPAGAEQVFFGPLDDVDRGGDTYSSLYRSSLYCASCHEGTLFGTKVYETFSEWSASSYARRGVECQHCHMKPDGVTRNIAPGHGGIERDPATLATHHFPGSTDESFLRASVEMKLSARFEGPIVRAAVTVRPVNVGHRLPTGTPERHLLLVVRAEDDGGTELELRAGPLIPDAGGVGPRDAGNYAGLPGKLYGKLLEGPGGEAPAPFWRAVAVRFDTRLQPDQLDRTEFTWQPSDRAATVRVRATLIYRGFYQAVRDAKAWPDRDVLLAEQILQIQR